jgi:hypothetical protein
MGPDSQPTSATATAAATAAKSAFRLGPGLVDNERTPFHLLLVELADGLRGLVVRAHLHEGEPARAACSHVPHHAYAVDLPRPAEQLGELILRGRVWKIADVESPAHPITYHPWRAM